MEADTYDFLLDFVLLGSKDNPYKSKISFSRSYKDLIQCINSNNMEELVKYLRGWYKGSQGSSWYDTHKIKDENLYYGYWCLKQVPLPKDLVS